ncbi:PilN domain-containing protein [Thermodesulfobacteriota bacterium]
MGSVLKDLFSPKMIVGLHITGAHIGAVQIFNALKGPEINKVAFGRIDNPDNLMQEVRDLFREQGFYKSTLITSIDSSMAVIRHIPQTLENQRKLSKIIKYQIEPFIPQNIEGTIVDFLKQENGDTVLAVAVEKEILSNHLVGLAQIGLEPEVVTLDDLALFSLYSRHNPVSEELPTCILNLGTAKKSVMIIHEKRLNFIRILSSGRKDNDNILNTFKLYQAKRPDTSFGEVLFTGETAPDEELMDSIKSQTQTEPHIWRPFDGFKHGLGDISTEVQSRLSVPLGLAYSMTDSPQKLVDFRKEEFVLKSAVNLKKMFVYTMSAVIFLILLFTFSLYQDVFYLNKKHNWLKDEIIKIYTSTFPDSPSPIKGRELAQMKLKIESETEKYQWLNDVSNNTKVLDLIKELTNLIALHKDVNIDNLAMEGDEIHLDGRAASFETVDRLKESFSASRFFTTVNLLGAKADQRDRMVRFNFSMEKKK